MGQQLEGLNLVALGKLLVAMLMYMIQFHCVHTSDSDQLMIAHTYNSVYILLLLSSGYMCAVVAQ